MKILSVDEALCRHFIDQHSLAVRVLMLNPLGQVLAVFQAKHKLWILPGGRVERAEVKSDLVSSFRSTLYRELAEEVGLNEFQLNSVQENLRGPVWQTSWLSNIGQEKLDICFFALVNLSDWQFVANTEIQDARWWDIPLLLKAPRLGENTRSLIESYQAS